jgi:hypothetical protein
MTFAKTTDKWTAAHAVINTWLKDQSLYCNNCGADYYEEFFPCCENPQVGRNIDHTKGLIDQNKEMRKIAQNEFSATPTKQMRLGVSLPPRLYHILNKYFKQTLNEPLFKDKKQMHEFMRRFRQFTIAERI